MAIPLRDRPASAFLENILDARRTERRLRTLKEHFNDCQRAAHKQDIHLARPSHILATPTALGWRWEGGSWTFLGLAEDELSDLPYYVLKLPVLLGDVPDLSKGHVSSHRTFIDALGTVQWQLGRGVLAFPR